MTSRRASDKSAIDRVFSLLSILGAVIAGFGLALGKRQRRARAIDSTRRNFRAVLALIWNTAIPGAGTNQAVMSFNVYAPVRQPHAAILGFYMNDFDDNMMPVDSYFMGITAVGKNLSLRQYRVDLPGNLLELDQPSNLYHRYHRVDPPANDIHRLVGTTRLGSLGLRVLNAARQMISKADGLRLRRFVDVTREYLIALLDAAAKRDTQLLVLLIPRCEDLSGIGTLYQNALQLMDELGITYLDPIDALDSETDYAAPPDVHLSNSGHQKIGEILVSCLQLFEAHGDLERCDVQLSISAPPLAYSAVSG